MTELLAIPGWNTAPTELAQWVECLKTLGCEVTTERESTGVTWLESTAYRLRGYAVMQGKHVEAINFELHADDPSPACLLLEQAALALSWDLSADEDDEPDEDDND